MIIDQIQLGFDFENDKSNFQNLINLTLSEFKKETKGYFIEGLFVTLDDYDFYSKQANIIAKLILKEIVLKMNDKDLEFKNQVLNTQKNLMELYC